ncbi:hypothetical protein FPOAC2_05170 [Fusarium poae]|jgi:hypothetical protein
MKRLSLWLCTKSFPLTFWIHAALSPFLDSQLLQIWTFATPCWPLGDRDYSAFWHTHACGNLSSGIISQHAITHAQIPLHLQATYCVLQTIPLLDFFMRTGPHRHWNWNFIDHPFGLTVTVSQYGWSRRKIGQVQGGGSTACFHFNSLTLGPWIYFLWLFCCTVIYCLFRRPAKILSLGYKEFKRLLISSVGSDCLKEDHETIIIAKV